MFKKILLAAQLFLIGYFAGFSQQILGGDITWTCVESGPNAGKFIFKLTLFNQCDSGNLPTSAQTITLLNGPISNISCALNAEKNISLPCQNPSQSISCSNSGSGAVSQGTYLSSPVTLNGVPPSGGWKFIYNAGNRPSASNLIGSTSMGLRSIMYPFQNQNAATCYDNSPQFIESPNTRFCTGYKTSFNHMPYDPDLEDYISFAFDDPWEAISTWPGNPVAFKAGYTSFSPFPTTFHDSLNTPAQIYASSGEISFSSVTAERITHVFKVSSYCNGVLKAEVYRDFVVDLISCPPSPTIPPLANNMPAVNISINGVLQPSPFTYSVVAGDSIEVGINSTDIQFNPGFIGQMVSLNPKGRMFGTGFSNPNSGCQYPPCAVLDTSSANYDPTLNNWVGNYGFNETMWWQTDSIHGTNANIHNFHFKVADDWCPTPGINERTVSLIILSPPPNTIEGVVFEDVNGNGTKDPGELGLQNVIVNETPNNFFYNTNSSGNYSLGAWQNNYTISVNPPLYYAITVPASGSHSITATGTGNTYSGNDFGLQPIPNVKDLRISITRSAALFPGDTVKFYLDYKNVGTTILNADIVFKLDTLLSFLSSSPSHNSVGGDSVTWSVSNITPSQIGSIELKAIVDTGAAMWTWTKFKAKILPISGDTTPLNNVTIHNATISNSYDPNNKVAAPEAYYNIDSNYVLLEDVQKGLYHEYTIHFQNTGNAAAKNVRVEDYFQTDLDLGTFEFLGSSHNVTYTIKEKTVTWNFPNINLPDSTSDYLGSMGYAKFRIRVDSTLGASDSIFNSVQIYFDYNSPIYAPSNVGIKDATIPDGIATNRLINDDVLIYPNPSDGFFTVVFNNNYRGSIQVTIYSIDGKTVGNHTCSSSSDNSSLQLDLSKYQKGLYFIRLSGQDLQLTRKIILK